MRGTLECDGFHLSATHPTQKCVKVYFSVLSGTFRNEMSIARWFVIDKDGHHVPEVILVHNIR